MATAVIGGGSYDYTQSLLPTDNRPLQLEGMRGGGGTAPTPEQMKMFRELLEEALEKEIPLENVEFEYVPVEGILRMKVFVTDGVATVSEETVLRHGEDLPAAAGAGARTAGAAEPTGIAVVGEVPATRPRAEAGGSAQNLGLNIFEPNYTSNFSVVTPEISAAPTINIAKIKEGGRVVIGENNEENNNEENNNSNPESVQEGGVLRSKRKTRRQRRAPTRTGRKNRPLRKSEHE